MVLIVSYDLHDPERNYSKIEAVLENAENWAHSQGSVWFLDTSDSPATWRDRLKAAGDSNDEFFVARLRKHWAAFNLDQDVAAWLKDVERSWD